MAATISAYALTSLADLKLFGGITTSSNDDALLRMINAASIEIENKLGYKIASRTHREWHNGRLGERRIVIKNPPITQVNRVSYGTKRAFSAIFASGANIRATLQVTGSAVITRSTAADGTVTETTSTFAISASVSALVAVLDALTGWTVATLSDAPSADLHPTAGMDALDTTVYATRPDQDTEIKWIDEDAGIIGLREDADDGWEPPDRGGVAFTMGFQNLLVEYVGGFANADTGDATSYLSQLCREFVMEAYTGQNKNDEVATGWTEERMERLRHWMDIPLGGR